MSTVLGIDIGTQSVKVLLLRRHQAVHGTSQRTAGHTPHP